MRGHRHHRRRAQAGYRRHAPAGISFTPDFRNDRVLRGLDKNSPRSVDLINRHALAILRRFTREFAVVDGSMFYTDLERGEISYRTYCLTKN